ncbi:TetR family transcriptional regulator [Actinobacteria bacterium YIM 96077]|uniref:TetR/AcrR family transcriptional regulator n=1 Tax=Phytoactinopolyspora halophila TaxID=1981511 RepID=A0A329QXK3_9ACTN|nr:TetR family transcriptional regulator C-terminal domain-containing protein [Phytoactinopolyspora halophila]AYY12768.1 TetR family transcriptional regulator [Actinobacteria bacterium YIM 96077]RAW16439.1 TetR/AcrR family transcriptional regulator [Phytoactinopolyspora halophila]
MPKVVDHDRRRRELAEAVLRVVVRRSVVGASVRAVATEAGWSTGALRYYFASQEELRAFAAETAWTRLRERVRARVEQLRSEPSSRELMARIVEELIPLDDERRQEYALWLALTEWERGRPAAERSAMWEAQRALYRAVVAVLTGSAGDTSFAELVGVAYVDEQVETWAEYLHVFVDGLASQAMNVPDDMPAERVRTLLRSFLAQIARSTAP